MSTKPPEDWNDLTTSPEDEAPRLELRPPRRPRRVLLPTLFALSLAALAAGWFGPLNPWPPGPSEAELAQGRKVALQLAEKAVRDYVHRNGRFPVRLDDAIALPAELRLEYVPRESGFELRIANDKAP